MSRVALDSVKGITVAQANRAELQRAAKLFRIKKCIEHRTRQLRMPFDGVVGREGFELLPWLRLRNSERQIGIEFASSEHFESSSGIFLATGPNALVCS